MEKADADSSAPGATVEALSAPSVLPASQDEIRAHTSWAIATIAVIFLYLGVLRGIPTVGWPILLATITAYLFDPLITLLARRGISRTTGTALLVSVGVVLSVIVLASAAPVVSDQIRNLPDYTLKATAALMDRINRLAPTVLNGTPIPHDLEQLKLLLQKHIKEIVSGVLSDAGSAVGTIVGGALQAVSFVLGALIVPVVTFFLLRGWPNLIAHADALIPARQRPFINARMREIDRVLGGFVRGQLTMAAVLSTLYSAALSLIGLKLGIVAGLVTGFGNLVPYVGTASGLLLSTGFCLVDFGADRHLIFVLITYALLVTTDSIFITPRVVGPRVGLSPAAVIIAVLTFGSLFGFAGVLLAVPSTAVLKVVGKTLLTTWKRSHTYLES